MQNVKVHPIETGMGTVEEISQEVVGPYSSGPPDTNLDITPDVGSQCRSPNHVEIDRRPSKPQDAVETLAGKIEEVDGPYSPDVGPLCIDENPPGTESPCITPSPKKKTRRPSKGPRVQADFRKKKSFSGVPFNRQFMSAVFFLFQYFSLEKLFGGPLKSVSKARERVSDALHISKRKVTDCVQKVLSASPLKTPNKNRNYQKTKTNLDTFTLGAIRNLIYEKSMNGVHVTLDYLLQTIRQREIKFYGSRCALRKVVLQLGFKFSRADGRRYLLEKPSIAAKRAVFLRKYMDLRKKYKFVFLNETWIFQRGGSKTKSWQDVDVRSCPVKGVNTGKRYIVLHAGGEDGWIDGCSLVFASGSKKGDYHGDMNGENFMAWWHTLLDRLHEPTVIVMDNAPYHSLQAKIHLFNNISAPVILPLMS